MNLVNQSAKKQTEGFMRDSMLRFCIFSSIFTLWVIFVFATSTAQDMSVFIAPSIFVFIVGTVYLWWIPILSHIEQRYNLYITTSVIVYRSNAELDLWDFKRLHPIIYYCYDKTIAAERNVFYCADENGKKCSFRIVASKQKMSFLHNELMVHGEKVAVTYGRYTKIAINTCSCRDAKTMKAVNMRLMNAKF